MNLPYVRVRSYAASGGLTLPGNPVQEVIMWHCSPSGLPLVTVTRLCLLWPACTSVASVDCYWVQCSWMHLFPAADLKEVSTGTVLCYVSVCLPRTSKTLHEEGESAQSQGILRLFCRCIGAGTDWGPVWTRPSLATFTALRPLPLLHFCWSMCWIFHRHLSMIHLLSSVFLCVVKIQQPPVCGWPVSRTPGVGQLLPNVCHRVLI